MSAEDTIEERQENELEVLKSIYGEDLVDLRGKISRNKWKPLHLSIRLLPLQGSARGLQEVHVKVSLHIACSNKYPNMPPRITLEQSRGMSNLVLSQLQSQLEAKAAELAGEVMIFELAEHVKAFLHSHNKPGTKSFYEEMVIRQKEKEQMEKEARELEKDRERQVLLREIEHRREILKEETRLRKEHRYSSDSNENSDSSNKRTSVTRTFDESFCEHKGTKLIKFSNHGDKEVQRGRCVDHFHGNCVTYSGLDRETGDIVSISEWNINIEQAQDIAQVQRQISSIEQELNYLLKLKHDNLARYLNLKHTYAEDDSKISVYVLKEFVYGSNCADLFVSGKPVDVDMLRHIAQGVLSALDFLHRNNVVHKDVCEFNVFVSRRGLVKLTNYSLDRRLSDLVTHNTLSTYNKKTDVYKFGILILSLLTTSVVNEDLPDIPQLVPNDLYDFLVKCLEKDEKLRWTVPQLLNHQFLKCPLEKVSPQRNVEDNNQAQSDSPEHQAKLLTHANSTGGLSRVQNEFDVLHCLGKGAYGEVFKVQNKLDQGFYAIKRIELNPKNKQLNKKIIREVKLLSRLNHENVVRYYNSWIESAVIENEDGNCSTANSSVVPDLPKVIQQKELTYKDDVELLAPPMKDVEWSISYESKSKTTTKEDESSDDDEDDDDDDDDEDDDDWGVMLGGIESDSDGVEFERDSCSESAARICSSAPSMGADVTDSSAPALREIQYMYIQMEFCEKSTLRTAIDAGLSADKDRVRRLFREIIEGLAHIHQQGMIHRDLKPVNIFLDSYDHVKIGDFGLATTNLLSRPNDTVLLTNKSYFENVDVSLTGHIGTALYVAPELTSTSKAIYNQKVDIYSLGIIYFEMCYKPLSTSMERITVLNSVRSKEIAFPKDFGDLCDPKQELLIRWLLSHDVAKRPTSMELLQSEHVPPPVLEECELRDLVRHTLNNPQLKAYKYLVASCFKQPTSCAHDIIYDRDPAGPNKHLNVYDFVKKTITKIFKIHGGQNLSTPLLMPKCQYYEDMNSCVKLMTHSGSIVTLPHDLRVPFARYVAWNGITSLRRYSVERVYWEKKVFGYSPREFYECAFDIVTPTPGNLVADAELLRILKELIDDLPGLKDKNFLIRLNHTSLVKAVLLHCGIKQKHNEIYNILTEHREGKVTKFQIQTHLISLGLSDSTILALFNFLEFEASIHKVASHFQAIAKKKSGEANVLVKQALQELKLVIHNIEAFGIEFTTVISPGLTSNIQQYSGVMFQLVCELKKKHKRAEVLAAGGRYDAMVVSYRNLLEKVNMSGKDLRQSAVGMSLYLDKVVQALIKDQSLELSSVDAVVCSVGTKALLKEKIKILTELWSAGIKATLIDSVSNEDALEVCGELTAHQIILKDTELGAVRVRQWERDRYMEKKINRSELIEYMQRSLKSFNSGSNEPVNALTALSRCDSKTVYADRNETHNHEANINVVFITGAKLSANNRKRFENQIRSQMDTVCQKLTGDVIVLVLNVDANVIRTLSSYLTFESDVLYNQSVHNIIDRHQRYKDYLIEVCEEISDKKSGKSNPIIILYSLSDSFYKVLL